MKKQCLATLVLLFSGVGTTAAANTQSAVFPWQPLAGAFDSSVNDGRILAFPKAETLGTGFFGLVEDSIMTMTADCGGMSRSVAAYALTALEEATQLCLPASLSCTPGDLDASSCWEYLPCIQTMTESFMQDAVPWAPGDVWENSNGGRGFTSSFCSGYGAAEGCAISADQDALGRVLIGPPTGGDGAPNLQALDVASTGWPKALRDALPALREGSQASAPEMCIAPAGLPDASAHDCAPGLTFRTGVLDLSVSPDAGRQWYPLSVSCGFANLTGPLWVATDAGQPGHVVTYAGVDDAYGTRYAREASGCPVANVAPACATRAIAWTADVSRQAEASFKAAASPEASKGAMRAVDAAGAPSDDTSLDGWRYEALGHLALDATANAQCDVAHAGIQKDCHAMGKKVCHVQKVSNGNTTSHEPFCTATDEDACTCGYTDSMGAKKTVSEALCTFPAVTSLAIDPRNGQVYAPSTTGLLFSPDGGRKWRRHGHSAFTPWGPNAGTSPTTEPWPYDNAPAGGQNEVNDPGVKILTMQGLPPAANLVATGDALALDLNAQPKLLKELGRVSFAATPCAGESGLFQDAMGFKRARIRVVATLVATWTNPLLTSQTFSSVFVAHADSCSDAAGRAPLVFRDTASWTSWRA